MKDLVKARNSEFAEIDWRRMAEPQDDRYDTVVTLELARRRGYVRREVINEPTFFDGRVALCQTTSFFLPAPLFVPASADHPNVAEGCEMVRLWPVVFRQFQDLVDSVALFWNVRAGAGAAVSSSTIPAEFGKMAMTINEDVKFAEALVHEMAHQKLRALGVDFEFANRIVINPPEQKFKSPIRVDSLRPMSAVLHAEYSFTYLTALDIEIIRSGKREAKAERIVAGSLAQNIPKLEFGYDVIRRNILLDDAGADFCAGFFGWLERVLEAGRAILLERGVPVAPFVHPLEVQPDEAPALDQPDAFFDVALPPEELQHEIGAGGGEAGLPPISMLSKPSRLGGIREYNFAGEMVLYRRGGKVAVSLNNSAAAIWELCDGQHTVADIGRRLGDGLGCSEDEALAELAGDVWAAVSRFYDFGLLTLK